MMNRRSFLKFLPLAPAALLIAPEAVKAARETEKEAAIKSLVDKWALGEKSGRAIFLRQKQSHYRDDEGNLTTTFPVNGDELTITLGRSKA